VEKSSKKHCCSFSKKKIHFYFFSLLVAFLSQVLEFLLDKKVTTFCSKKKSKRNIFFKMFGQKVTKSVVKTFRIREKILLKKNKFSTQKFNLYFGIFLPTKTEICAAVIIVELLHSLNALKILYIILSVWNKKQNKIESL
jgi:hypothetical protein